MSVRTTLFAEDKFVISKEEGSVQCHTGEVEDIVDSVMPCGGVALQMLEFCFKPTTF
jgi:hypothetical protein